MELLAFFSILRKFWMLRYLRINFSISFLKLLDLLELLVAIYSVFPVQIHTMISKEVGLIFVLDFKSNSET